MSNARKGAVDLHRWQVSAIERGLRDTDAGRVVQHEDVVAWVESRGRPDERPMPKCE